MTRPLPENYELNVSKHTGCFNNSFQLYMNWDCDVTIQKLIMMKYNFNAWIYLRNSWQLSIINTGVQLTKGIKDKNTLTDVLNDGCELAKEIFTFTDFQYNVVQEILKKEK